MTKKVLKIALMVIISTTLQTVLIAKLKLFGVKADLPLAVTIAFALFSGSFYGEIFGFLSGFLTELNSGGPIIGVQPFCNALTGYLIGLLRNRLFSDNLITQTLSGLGGTFANKVLAGLFLSLILRQQPLYQIRLFGIILASIINCILVILSYSVVKKGFKEHTAFA